MFNGIIFNTGKISGIKKRSKGINLYVRSSLRVSKKNLGISISCDGVCLTLISYKNKILEFPSTPIIVNAANEILVDHFLNKKLQFLGINKIIMSVLNDRNYKKYAIRKPKNINHIIKIDKWARETANKYVL